MEVTRIVNSLYCSNTYILSDASSDNIWLIDIGDFTAVLNHIGSRKINGVFITHSHFDHIYGINLLIDHSPSCQVYLSESGRGILSCDKLNMSYYHDIPTVFDGLGVTIIRESDKIEVFRNAYLEVLETPGHNIDCLTFKIENYIFTGDSFIPYKKIVTKLRGGDKRTGNESLNKIWDNLNEDTLVCPGHGEIILAQRILSNRCQS